MEKAIADWETLKSDLDAVYDTDIAIDVSDLAPYVTWGTNPGMGVQFGEKFPEIQDKNDERAYNYMDLQPGQTAEEIPLGFVFIGSCTKCASVRSDRSSEVRQGRESSCSHPGYGRSGQPGQSVMLQRSWDWTKSSSMQDLNGANQAARLVWG